MITKDVFLNELNTYNLTEDPIIYKKFIQAYDLYQIGGDSTASSLVDELLEYLFSPNLKFSDFYIPRNFLNLPIGLVLFSAKFNSNSNNLFTLTEVALLTNKSKAMISIDMKNNHLMTTKLSKGSFVVSEADLIAYMQLRNFSLSAAKDKIHKLLVLKNKNIPLSEIKTKLNQ